jgi:hypothetical protein
VATRSCGIIRCSNRTPTNKTYAERIKHTAARTDRVLSQATSAYHSKSNAPRVLGSNPQCGAHVKRPRALSGGLSSTKRMQSNSSDHTGEYQEIRSGMLVRDGPYGTLSLLRKQPKIITKAGTVGQEHDSGSACKNTTHLSWYFSAARSSCNITQ